MGSFARIHNYRSADKCCTESLLRSVIIDFLSVKGKNDAVSLQNYSKLKRYFIRKENSPKWGYNYMTHADDQAVIANDKDHIVKKSIDDKLNRVSQ